jgi:hypothetical protein
LTPGSPERRRRSTFEAEEEVLDTDEVDDDTLDDELDEEEEEEDEAERRRLDERPLLRPLPPADRRAAAGFDGLVSSKKPIMTSVT